MLFVCVMLFLLLIFANALRFRALSRFIDTVCLFEILLLLLVILIIMILFVHM